MEVNLYESIVNRFCFDDFFLENVRIEEPSGMFKSTIRDFDLIVFNTKKVIFVVKCIGATNQKELLYKLRGALSSLVGKLSLSLNDFVVCGADEENYFFLNKYNDRLISFSRNSAECFKILEYIENELSYGVNKFEYSQISALNDSLILSPSINVLSKTKEKIKQDVSGKTLINVRGTWREASDLNTETLFSLAAFGGMLGLHLFYQKKMFKGVFYLLTLGLCGIGWFFDCIEIILGIYKDTEGKYLIPLENKISGLIMFLFGGVVFFVVSLIFMFLFNFLSGSISNLSVAFV